MLYFGFLLMVGIFSPGCHKNERAVLVSAKNDLDISRSSETLVLSVAKLKSMLPGEDVKKLGVFDKISDKHIISQWIDYDGNGNYDELIFQSDFASHQTKYFLVKRTEKRVWKKAESKVYCRFVPERKDDFAWENDRIAYRMYGSALQASGQISSGVDVWVKRVRYLIINKWYALGDYHKDHGEGLDAYKVGSSRGCGGLGIWNDGKLYVSKNFTRWKILANGPIRLIFELTYAPWNVNGDKISEIKRVTLDAGQNLSRFESIFTSKSYQSKLICAIGIRKRADGGDVLFDKNQGVLGYWQPPDKPNGTIGCGIVMKPDKILRMVEAKGHYFIFTKVTLGKPLIYYAGAGWSKSGDFAGKKDWMNYLKEYSVRLASPIEIELSKI